MAAAAASAAAATAAEDGARLLRLEEQAGHGGGGAWEYLCLARRLRARRPEPVLRLGLALLNDSSARSRLASEQWTLYEQVAVAAMDCQRLDVAKVRLRSCCTGSGTLLSSVPVSLIQRNFI
jgi:hypothetical protein